AEIPCTTSETRVLVLQSPRVAAVVGTIEASFLCLNECVHTFSIRRHSDARASPVAVGKPVTAQARPRLACILRAVESAARSIDRSIRAPRRTMSVPCAGEKKLGVAGADCQVRNTKGRS